MATGTPSLAARCTTCQTVFRVVPDQLRVSGGWVRCGRCSAVFNAAENLVELEDGVVRRSVRLPATFEAPRPPAPAPTPTPTPPPPPAAPPVQPDFDLSRHPPSPPASPSVPPAAGIVATSDGAVVSDWNPTRPFGDSEPGAFVVDPPAPPPAGEPDIPLEPLEPPSSTQPGPEPEPRPEPAPDGASVRQPDPVPEPTSQPARPAAASPEATAPGTEPAPMPSFVRKAERAQRWAQPRVQLALAVASLMLVLLLAAQVLREYRDLAAARYPALKPVLTALCSATGCRVGDARAIDGLAVESSGLVRIERSDRYRLSVALRNRAGIDLAVPALDLQLTDSQGRLLARRVLQLSELGVTQPTVPAGRELSLQATLRAAPGTPGEAVAGYTIELFYP